MSNRYMIIGAGLGGLSAAWKITEEDPDAEVDIYEAGWRAGGKLHSSESLSEPENKEHGLHVLFGFYINAFKLLHDVYEELDDLPGMRFDALTDIMEPQRFGVVYDKDSPESERQWVIHWPDDPRTPGEDTQIPDPASSLISTVRVLLKIAESLLEEERASWGRIPEWIRRVREEVEDIGEGISLTGERVNVERLKAVHEDKPETVESDAERRARMLADIALGVFVGLRKHLEKTGGFNLDPLDKWSLSEWLENQGVSKESANSAFIHMYREAAFGYRDGRESAPDFAAGAALRALIRIFAHYRGCVTWKLVAGAGEAIVAPIYVALRHRGVQFHFFHRLEKVWEEQGETRVRLQKQAEVEDFEVYEFIKQRPAGGVYWPDAPDFDELVDGERLQEWGGRLDDPNQVVPEGVAPENSREEMVVGPGGRYDTLILATGLGPLKVPSSDGTHIVDSPQLPIVKTLKNLDMVSTIAAQFYLAEATEEMGWTGELRSPGLSGLPRPLSIAADMTQAGLAAGTYYLCSAYPLSIHHMGGGVDDASVRGEVFEKIVSWCEESGHWLYNAADGERTWNWRLLLDEENREGSERLKAQYIRLNNRPMETCIGCHSGNNLHLLGPGESGLPHVVLAGAWTRTGLNVSSFEASVMSGFRAARAVLGLDFEVPGESFMSDERG